MILQQYSLPFLMTFLSILPNQANHHVRHPAHVRTPRSGHAIIVDFTSTHFIAIAKSACSNNL